MTPTATPEPISYYATYFRLYDGHVWPDCTRQRTNRCLKAGIDLVNLYHARHTANRLANVKVYPCDTDTNDLFNDFNRDIEDYPSSFMFTDYLIQECGFEPYWLAEGEISKADLPPLSEITGKEQE